MEPFGHNGHALLQVVVKNQVLGSALFILYPMKAEAQSSHCRRHHTITHHTPTSSMKVKSEQRKDTVELPVLDFM